MAQLLENRYELLECLGAGGFGRVWRARDKEFGVDVAVKQISMPESATEEERANRLARARREARHAAALRDHPNVVTIYDVVTDGEGTPWLVMQLVVGRSLAEHLEAGHHLSGEHVVKVARALLSALSEGHARGINHRDVKPANVLMADNGDVLLTDFGIAAHSTDPRLTAVGQVVGSAEHLPPERIDGKDGDARSDLFSLGTTLYHAATGVSPFRRATFTETLGAVAAYEPPPPSGLGSPLTGLIMALMAKDPARRPTPQQALAGLNGGVGGGSGAVSQGPAFAGPAAPATPATMTAMPVPLMPSTPPGPSMPSMPPGPSMPSMPPPAPPTSTYLGSSQPMANTGMPAFPNLATGQFPGSLPARKQRLNAPALFVMTMLLLAVTAGTTLVSWLTVAVTSTELTASASITPLGSTSSTGTGSDGGGTASDFVSAWGYLILVLAGITVLIGAIIAFDGRRRTAAWAIALTGSAAVAILAVIEAGYMSTTGQRAKTSLISNGVADMHYSIGLDSGAYIGLTCSILALVSGIIGLVHARRSTVAVRQW